VYARAMCGSRDEVAGAAVAARAWSIRCARQCVTARLREVTAGREGAWRRPDRVFITGGAGSGKTTIGRQLAQRWSLRHYQMDLGESDEAFAQPRWLIEGGMLWDVERFLDRADLIVWLDLSPAVTIPRILTRHVTLSLRGQNRHPGLRRIVGFVRVQPRYYRAPARRPTGPLDYSQTRAGTEEILAPYRARVVHLRTPRDVRRWLHMPCRRALGRKG
jgi:adenylate kinase family enzyme